MGSPSGTGGAASGGDESGGSGGGDTGGSGGRSSGGASSGGAASGGNGSGGVATGGAASGGSGGGMSTGGSGTGGAFNPDIPRDGLMLWLRADAGITLATGQRVATWQDMSPSGVSALQTANTWRPTLIQDGLNGKPAVQFDGVDDFLNLPSGDADLTAGLSMFIVLQEDAAPTSCTAYLSFSNGPEVDDITFGNYQDHVLYEVYADFTSGQDSLVLEQGQLLTYIHGKDGSIQLRRDAQEIGLSSFALPAKVERSQNYIGRSLYVDCQLFAGRISEILMYDRGVDDEELVNIESYLQGRWLNP